MTRIANSDALGIAFWSGLLEKSATFWFGLRFSDNAIGQSTLRCQDEQKQIGAFAVVHRSAIYARPNPYNLM
jgi:hypothetical protein